MKKNTMRKCEMSKRFLSVLLVIGFPFIYLFPYAFPLHGEYIGIDNDFHILYYNYKVYLLDFLSRMSIPLWSPAEAAGFPFYSSPFTQTFYPFNILLAIYYRVVGGYTALDHQRFTVFGISIFAFGLFLWLRKLNLNLRAALFSALVMAVSFKVTEIIRFPNAVHTAAWYPWVLYAVTGIFQAKSNRDAWRHGAILFFSLICLFTGGYPYYIFYSIFLFVPYSMLFFLPSFRKTIFSIQKIEFKRTFVTLFTAGLLTLAICSPYLVKMASLMSQTTDRSGGNYEYSTEYLFNLTDSIGSLFFPPAAQFEGIYYFSAVGILLIIFYVLNGKKGVYTGSTPIEVDDGRKTQASDYIDLWLKFILLTWIGLISYITHGRESHLFNFLWYNMPMFSSLRVWGRMNIVLVPIFAWFLALAYQYFELTVFFRESQGDERFERFKQIVYLLLSSSLVFAYQINYLATKTFDDYWMEYIAPINVPAIWAKYFAGVPWFSTFFRKLTNRYAIMQPEDILSIIGILFIIFTVFSTLILFYFLLIKFFKNTKFSPNHLIFLAILFMVSMVNMGFVGPWLWVDNVLEVKSPYQLEIKEKDQRSFQVMRTANAGITFSSAFHVNVYPNWYFQRYVSFLRAHATEASLDQLLGVNDGKKLYFSERIDYSMTGEFLRDAERFKDYEEVLSYTGDKLVVDVHVPLPGFFSFIDNWDEDWKATVDGKTVPIDLLFGTFKSVRLTAGDHQVIFEYRPTIWSLR